MRARSMLLVLGVLAIGIAAPAMSQLSQQQLRDMSIGMAKVIGMSPDGTKFWAEKSVVWSQADDYRRLTEVQAAIGDQLSLQSPDHVRLNALVNEYASESARLARTDKDRLIGTAFKLSQADRQKLGAFITKGARDDLGTSKPVLSVLP